MNINGNEIKVMTNLVKHLNNPDAKIQADAIMGIKELADMGNETAQIIFHAILDGPIDDNEIKNFLNLVNSSIK
jgi:hypothetical protein